MTQNSNIPSYLLEHTPWENISNPIWLSTTFTLQRNLARRHFPGKMNERQIQQTLSELKELLSKSPQLKNPLFLNAEQVTPLEKEFLFEHFFCQEGFQNTLIGQGFAIDETAHFLAGVNIQNHLQLHLTDSTGSWEQAWNHLDQIEMAIGSGTEYAFSSKFGYLTSDPGLCGTGLTVQAFLHLPALIHTGQLEEALLKQSEEGINYVGMRGTIDELIGDILVVSNLFTLGVNEENILQSIQSVAMRLMALEKAVRSHLQLNDHVEIKDQISRAFGLLLHSYQLQTKEALDALSLIKLGVNLDWISGITDTQINTLFFKCRRAHLLHVLGETQTSDPQHITRKRAELLHKSMQGVVLKYESTG